MVQNPATYTHVAAFSKSSGCAFTFLPDTEGEGTAIFRNVGKETSNGFRAAF
jgi:hypothetical protein